MTDSGYLVLAYEDGVRYREESNQSAILQILQNLMLTFDITNVWWGDGGRNEGGMSVGHWKERNACVGDKSMVQTGIGMGGKNGGTRSGMSAETREGGEWVCE